MKLEEECQQLREENRKQREHLAQRDERSQQLETRLEQQAALIQQMQEQIVSLTQQVKSLQERQAKDSHKSSLPPSSDRFTRKTKSLRKTSEKQSGGQDRWGSYFLYPCEHALCLVHLLRDVVFLAEEHDALWAADLKDLLLDMKTATEQGRVEGKRWLHPLDVADWEAAFLRLLDEAELVTPRATAPPGNKGRCKHSAARNLLDSLHQYQHAIFCFLEALRVDFDNNLAQRDLRMMKVQRKISGCFRSLAGAQAFRRIRGYLSTLRKQGLPLLSALQATLCGHPVLPSL